MDLDFVDDICGKWNIPYFFKNWNFKFKKKTGMLAKIFSFYYFILLNIQRIIPVGNSCPHTDVTNLSFLRGEPASDA